MSEISIQVRRVTEKVKQYYQTFGLRPYARMSPGRSVIRGSKRLGFDEIECVVAETARGTSVGFYPVNQFQGLLHAFPLLFTVIIIGLAQVESIAPFLLGTGETSLPGNLPKLLAGGYTFSFSLIMLFLGLIALFAVTDYLIQRIRLEILKSRFSFYTRDAVYETREIPLSLISLQALRSIFHHGWMFAVIYFGIFAAPPETLNELSTLYNSSTEGLYSASIDGFVITVGLIFGLILSYKAILLRKEYSRFDDRYRISGGLTERRLDPVIYGMQSALLGGSIFVLFLSNTFLSTATASQLGLFIFYIMIGAAIAGLVHSEGDGWILASYAVFIFVTSLLLIFRTGEEPAYAYIVVLQLFFIPLPFALFVSFTFERVLQKQGIKTKEWYFDVFPMLSFVSLYLNRRKQQAARRSYEESLEEEISLDELDRTIRIEKEIFSNTQSNAYRSVRHYFELLFTYTASFEETQFITLPNFSQLSQWWKSKTGDDFSDEQTQFIRVADQLLWDPSYQPSDSSLETSESVGKSMVLAIQ